MHSTIRPVGFPAEHRQPAWFAGMLYPPPNGLEPFEGIHRLVRYGVHLDEAGYALWLSASAMRVLLDPNPDRDALGRR